MTPYQLVPMDLDSLSRGACKKQINEALAKCVADIDNRPEIGKDRSITVEITLSPPALDDNQRTMSYKAKVQTKLPPPTGVRGSAIIRDGAACVHEFGDEDVHQYELPNVHTLRAAEGEK